MRDGLTVTFWGTRGSMAAPYPDRMIYGGNTSCVSAAWGENLIIFDAGTGIRELGMQLLKENRKEIHIFISHLHLDHVIGISFFPQMFVKDCRIHIYGAEGIQKKMEQFVSPPFWPVSLEKAPAELIWHEIAPNACIMLSETAEIQTFPADHPDGSLLYRLNAAGESLVYGLDCELTETVRRPYMDFVRGCELLIFDGTYTEEEYPKVRGYGHSTWEQGIEIKNACGIKTLCISHHDWGRTDEELAELEKKIQNSVSQAFFAREGMQICLEKGEEDL